MTDYKQDISADLQQWCVKWRITHKAAADKLGLPFRTFHNWYYGITDCPVAQLLKFRLMFGPDYK